MLVLFDIDGTLLLTGGAGQRALESAFLDLYGWQDACKQMHLGGKTDPSIVAEVFRSFLGRSPDGAETDKVLSAYLVYLAEEIAVSRGYRILPGVSTALAALEEAKATIGLATGNVESGARIKLLRGDLWQRFPFGGFGSDSHQRAVLVARAIERATDRSGRSFAEIFVVGDTPSDIEAARACGVHSIGVATGPYSLESLRAAGAETVLDTLLELPAWLGTKR